MGEAVKYAYVVMGTTGEPDARKEWTVIAYADKLMAEMHAAMAKERAEEIEAGRTNLHEAYRGNFWDSSMKVGAGGTSYCVQKVHLIE